ncbi:hypothetical protein BS47DRAFT_1397287 [Hydnum rufescens UP504]|uniref:Uncharacterized protein n=1 Tax=Hydnum rufescens UP504 TaxID=1448309 RepID=A0A9P6ANG9_9AGAM|nr:hypothetical protein BS47DRAFT_1397287 [Hydnum rufescens UP504]
MACPPSTAYSVSGHVVLTVTPSTSLLNNSPIRPPSFRLTSLTVIFEGKCESLSPNLGYGAVRVCRVSKELVGGTEGAAPVTLSCAGGDASEQIWQWSVLFDLAIPGWLPPSVDISEFTETAYSLHASLTLETLDPPSQYPHLGQSHPRGKSTAEGDTHGQTLKRMASSWSIPSFPTLLYSTFGRSKERTIHSDPVPVTIIRVRAPTNHPLLGTDALHDSPSLFPAHFQRASPTVIGSATDPLLSAQGIPLDLLSTLEVVVSLPQYTAIEEGFIPLGLKIRCPPEKSGERKLRLHEFEAQVYQVEKFRSTPDSRFASTFPIPTQQPPSVPLLNPNYMEALHACGLLYPHIMSDRATRTHPLIPEGHIFFRPATGGVLLDSRWARMDVKVPILRASTHEAGDDNEVQEDGKAVCDEHRAERRRRREYILPDFHAPFLRVSHEIRISVKVSWDQEGVSGTIRRMENVRMSFPLRFTRTPGTTSGEPPLLVSCILYMLPLSSSTQVAYPIVLPAYSQLFHENGERKEDDEGIWLPPYSKEDRHINPERAFAA